MSNLYNKDKDGKAKAPKNKQGRIVHTASNQLLCVTLLAGLSIE